MVGLAARMTGYSGSWDALIERAHEWTTRPVQLKRLCCYKEALEGRQVDYELDDLFRGFRNTRSVEHGMGTLRQPFFGNKLSIE